jgi:hypothetical protein
VAQDKPIRVALELDSLEDPIAGRLSPEQGAQIAFSGWLELISALQSLLGEATTGVET